MLEKRDWVARHADHVRRALMLEPRGHADMYGALLTEAVSPESHAGILFMHNEGYSTMCGHGIIAATTIAIERRLIVPGGQEDAIVFDTPAGVVRARATVVPREDGGAGIRVERVLFQSVPSFVLRGGVPVKVGARELVVDVAYGGAFYAIVDSEAAGLPLERGSLPELRRMGMAIKEALEATSRIVHPLERSLEGLYGTIFTGPAHSPDADLRNATIFADSQVDRSPCGTGTCAVLAVLDAMGLVADGQPFVHESVIGTRFTGRIVRRTIVGDQQAIVAEIEGSAWITGDHTFVIDEADPLREGFRL
jgi:proline racemase